MKIKVSETTPIQLDWLVAAKCENILGNITQAKNWGELCKQRGGVVFTHRRLYSPSVNWAQGGPIIEREGIDLYCNVPTNLTHSDPSWRGSWRAKYHRCGFGTEMSYGPTPLIAAMRCFVASKLGDEVEIPEELS